MGTIYKNRGRVLLILLLMLWQAAGIVSAQSSLNFQNTRSALGGIGGVMSSPTYVNASALGQISGADRTSSPSFVNYAGTLDESSVSKASQYLLTLSYEGTGQGSILIDGVTSDSSTDSYPTGSTLTLTVVSDENSVFLGWADACSGTGECRLTIERDTVVTALFGLKTFTVVAEASEGGVIEPSGAFEVAYGTDVTFTMTPSGSYELVDLLVDGVRSGSPTIYTFTNVTEQHTIQAIFSPDTYAITTETNSGGQVTPAGPMLIQHGASATFTITPDADHCIAALWIDGVKVQDLETYLAVEEHTSVTKATVDFSEVTFDHSIQVFFSKASYADLFWAEQDFSDSLFEDWAAWDDSTWNWFAGDHLLSVLEPYLDQQYEGKLLIYAEGQGQVLTAYEYIYDAEGQVAGIWVGDPDDATQRTLLSAVLDSEQALWHLSSENLPDFGDWLLAGVVVVKPEPGTQPIPEPGTLLLFGLGLLSLLVLGKKYMQHRDV